MMKVKSYWPAALWALVIFVLTILPSHKIPNPPDWDISIDKLVHFGLFMVLSLLLLFRQHAKSGLLYRQQLIWITILLVIYGLLLEMAQILVPTRNFSWLDLIADALGAIAGNFIYLGIVKLTKGLPDR